MQTNTESGWRCWIVAIACFWTNFFIRSVYRSFAVLYVVLIDDYNVTREDAAWPAGVQVFFVSLSGLLSGYLARYFNIRSVLAVAALTSSVAVSLCSQATRIEHIAILYGAFYGAGMGTIICLTHIIINSKFTRFRATAIGIANAGPSVGSFVLPPLLHWMTKEYQLRGTFLLLGGIMLHSLVGIMLMRFPETSKPDKKSIDDSQTNDSSITRKKSNNSIKKQSQEDTSGYRRWRAICRDTVTILRNADYCLLNIVYMAYFLVAGLYNMVIVDFAQEASVPRESGVYLVSVFAFGDLAARLSSGYVADTVRVGRNTIVCFFLLLKGVTIALLSLCRSYDFLMATSVILGILFGSIHVNHSPLIAECLDRRLLPLGIGMAMFPVGITSFARPAIIGYFRDHLQNYRYMFILLGSAEILIVITWWFVGHIRKLKSPRKNSDCRSKEVDT